MPTRTGRLTKPDSQGQYARQLGWKLNARGRRVQHKFRLGVDPRLAERRDHLLRRVWETIQRDAAGKPALWDDTTLEIARQVARGEEKVLLEPLSVEEPPRDYANRLQRLQDRFAFLRFAPADESRFTKGVGDAAIDLRQMILVHNPYEEYWRGRETQAAPPLLPRGPVGAAYGPSLEESLASYRVSTDDGKTLHQALDAYVSWIHEHYLDEETGELTDHAYTKIGRVDTLKARHEDAPLAGIDYQQIESIYRVWRRRPKKRLQKGGEGARVTRSSAQNYIGELRRFFKWLHRSKAFSWRKPEDFDDIERDVPRDVAAIKKSIRQVNTFRLEDLQLLNRHATPEERLYLMLGLNCGFGAKEIATLTIGEVALHQALPEDEQTLLGFPSTDADSFISLVRNKSITVGKFLLFEQTTKMLQWNHARRITHPDATPDQPAILNAEGKPLDARTAGKNPSRHIPRAFDRLRKRVKRLEPDAGFNDLPFKFLRKTSSDLVRRFSGGEIAQIFLIHSNSVQSDKLSDVYTNRPFGKLYEALRQAEEHWRPVFEEAGDDPTREIT